MKSGAADYLTKAPEDLARIPAAIEAALARCHGRVEGPFGAARLLEMNPHTLRSKMRKLGIVGKRYRDVPGNLTTPFAQED